MILDLGCGSGFAISKIAGTDAELTVGVDAWRSSQWAVGPEAAFVVADIVNLPFRDGVADVVLSLDVIEHLQDDRAALADAVRVLRPGGMAIVMVPAFPVLWSNHDDLIGHYRRYRVHDLTDLLSGLGLRIVQRSYLYSWLFPIALVRRAFKLGNERDATPGALAPVAHVLGWLERFLIRWRIVIPFGSSAFTEAVRGDRIGGGAESRHGPNTRV